MLYSDGQSELLAEAQGAFDALHGSGRRMRGQNLEQMRTGATGGRGVALRQCGSSPASALRTRSQCGRRVHAGG